MEGRGQAVAVQGGVVVDGDRLTAHLADNPPISILDRREIIRTRTCMQQRSCSYIRERAEIDVLKMGVIVDGQGGASCAPESRAPNLRQAPEIDRLKHGIGVHG